MDGNFWTSITKQDQYRTISDLVKDGATNGNYYPLLILSSIIIAAGVLLANSAILIGGMLVTPLMTPILLIALSVTTSKPKLLKRTMMLLGKSIFVVFIVSFLAGFIFNVPESEEFFNTTIFNDTLRSAFLYFVVALASGVAATYAWVRREITNILPGISIAVSLVPPLAMVAIWISAGEFDLSRFFLMVFLFNLFGILIGAMIVFSMLRFYRSEDQLNASIKELEISDALKKEQKLIKEIKEKEAEERHIEAVKDVIEKEN